MNREDIVRFAREAGLINTEGISNPYYEGCVIQEQLERFFDLAFAAGMNAEREKWKAYVSAWGTKNAVQDAVAEIAPNHESITDEQINYIYYNHGHFVSGKEIALIRVIERMLNQRKT